MAKAKVILWDIEATNLNASFGRVLCVGWKLLGESKTHIISCRDFAKHGKVPFSDKEVVSAAKAVLDTADVWVHWYGDRFDIPFVNTRLLHHGLAPLAPVPSVDGWRIARNRLKLHSNRLQSVLTFLEVGDKTALTPQVWERAAAGDAKAIKYIEVHCKVDVEKLELAYQRIKPLALNHPNIALIEGAPKDAAVCPLCASKRVQMRGYTYAGTSRKRKFVCLECGHWSRTKTEPMGAQLR